MAGISLRSSSSSSSISNSNRGCPFPHAIWQWVKVGRMSYLQILLWTLASNAVMFMICRERVDYSLLSMTYDGILFAATGAANTNNNYELALHHSLGYFDDIPAEQWQKFFVTPMRTAQHYVNPVDPNAGSDNPNVWYYNNWIPVIECPHLMKLGGLVDGGKWTCDPERIPRAVQRRQQQSQQQQGQQQPNHPNNIATGWYVLCVRVFPQDLEVVGRMRQTGTHIISCCFIYLFVQFQFMWCLFSGLLVWFGLVDAGGDVFVFLKFTLCMYIFVCMMCDV